MRFTAKISAHLLVAQLAILQATAQEVELVPQLPKAAQTGAAFTNSIEMKFVYVPPGEFFMGSPEDEKGRFEDEQRKEFVIERGFYLGKYEVTQEQYANVAGKNPSVFKGAKLPVESVLWKEANEFCRLLSVQENRGGKDGRGESAYRLPSEAEWEYACRAGTSTPFHFGRTITPKDANYGYFHVKKNGTMNVGSFPANAWGLHDMHGNVWEWCEDSPPWYRFQRVLRGGSWGCEANYCRCAAREGLEKATNGNVGFRVLLPIAN